VAGFEPAADSLDTITKVSLIVKFLQRLSVGSAAEGDMLAA